MILILADWLKYFWEQGFRFRAWGLGFANVILWIPSTFFPAQKNIIDMSRYLDSHSQITEVVRFNKNPQWITEVFIRRTDWVWRDVETLPTEPMACTSRLVMNIKDYENLKVELTSSLENLEIETIFETNLIEKVAYRLNPEKNLRRTPLVLLKNKGC